MENFSYLQDRQIVIVRPAIVPGMLTVQSTPAERKKWKWFNRMNRSHITMNSK